MSLEESIFRRQPQQKRSHERVEQILQAAAEVFWEVGYDAATTHAIAQRAHTAVGTLYRFFPNKLAIFHALEKQHRLSVEAIQASLMTPELMQQPLAIAIQQIVMTFAAYFEDLAPRVVYVQYALTPDIFIYFDDSVTYGFARRFANMLRSGNSTLSVEKSELIAEVFIQTYNSLLLLALRSNDADRRAQLYTEIQDILVNYLHPHVGDPASALPALQTSAQSATQQHNLNSRQQVALAHVLNHGSLTIQVFESLFPKRSRRTLQRDLKRLINQGILRSEGDTNQLTYRLMPKMMPIE
jgi:AcrR family transcriptional regulator